MTIRAFIKKGPHIAFHNTTPFQTGGIRAFGCNVADAELDPNIEVSSNIHRSPIQPGLAAVVRYWSVYDTFRLNGTNSNQRKIGVYTFKSAKGTVAYTSGDGFQSIRITGENILDCMALFDMILAGTIAPSVPYDGPQVKSTVLSVKDALYRLIESIAVAWTRFKQYGLD